MTKVTYPSEEPLFDTNPSVSNHHSDNTHNKNSMYNSNSNPNGIGLHDPDFDAQAIRDGDGRITISLDTTGSRLGDITSRFQEKPEPEPETDSEEPPTYHPYTVATELGPAPYMNIVIQVVGSRGDVQPFLALARVLKQVHGHHVRLATHPKFESLVENAGIEFFSIGGDPAELMDYMVNNAGLMPGVEALFSGDIARKQRFMGEIAEGCWRSCIEPDAKTGKPFIADAIIANPPSFAHVHCAEKLAVPLHLMFTMPWTPSLSFPHPLANIQPTTASPQTSNLISFHLVEMLIWQGLGDIINVFRVQTLGLEPLSSLFAPGLTWRLKIPFTYAWSPALLARPKEWGNHVNISGYFNDPTQTAHDPSPELAKFLESGNPPIYIGFGSIKFDNSAAITQIILAAVERSGVRAIISRGWAKLGSHILPDEVPETVLFVDDTPHPWLFPRCSAVVHHGGAGTTTTGLSAGRPTVVVPFFGDQWFWGDMVARRGAGPKPIPFKHVTVDSLSEAINFALRPECSEAAREIANAMHRENGCEAGAGFFHAALQSRDNRCAVCPERIACWKIRKSPSSRRKPLRSKASSQNDDNSEIKLSALTAAVLIRENKIDVQDLELLRAIEYDNSTANAPWDPVSSLLANTTTTVSDILKGVAAGPREAYKQVNASKERAKAQRSNAGGDSSMQTSWDERTLGTETSSQNGDEKSEKGSISAGITNPSVSDHATPRTSSSSMNAAGAVALESTKGVGRIMSAGLKTPVTFTNGLARGFHNVPNLYNDDTVRPEAKIDGVKSGLVAAGKGFGHGLYDGLTGLVTQPYNGAKKDGAVGFLKGVGKGLGGVVFKPSAGACGVPGYAFMGVYKSLMKLRKGDEITLDEYLAASRIAQGEEEVAALGSKDWEDIVGRWGVEVATGRASGLSGPSEEKLKPQGTGMSNRSFRSEKSKESMNDEKGSKTGDRKEWEEYEYFDNATAVAPSTPAPTRNITGASGDSMLTEQQTGVIEQARQELPVKQVSKDV
ncbi:uncharacterized protein BP5553_03040 [Venustampulla echinocandica]|uniref:Uncharacterized protein n=1 Tax=Venustampulla echinocandica TaxID=2656787 RepID=A0A370TT41_9HELO|nr:uncharacterized protein BP5553_03040 [Venustampulla echinocandica]RDL38700.1 hypothetical protein BP5553_03040 [Venustampulla echinocandica]